MGDACYLIIVYNSIIEIIFVLFFLALVYMLITYVNKTYAGLINNF